MLSFKATIDALYFILDTDYNNYAVIFACGSFSKILNGQMAWVLSRNREISEENLRRAFEVFESQKIRTNPLIYSDQRDCGRDDDDE